MNPPSRQAPAGAAFLLRPPWRGAVHPRASLPYIPRVCAAWLAGCDGGGRPAPPSRPPLPVPVAIADGATVDLRCGRVYQGTLDLNGRSHVTVRTVGACGKAAISPGREIAGWTRERGAIYSAPVGFVPVQLALDGAPLAPAHWPDAGWARAGAAPPHADLDGATLVWLDNQSVVKTRALAGRFAGTGKPFYVEGKLWMLDRPGEWAYAHGRIHAWPADGRSPEGRAWASPRADGIAADRSHAITISNVRIFGASNGISADTSTGLTVLDTDIADSDIDGIWASGSRGLTVRGSRVSNARRNGIDGWYSVTGAIVSATTVQRTGMRAMPSPSDAGIFFGDGSGNRIANVRVTDSAYHGISVLHNRATSVLDSVVDNACARLTDCGGIYTGARDREPLALTIAGNTVSNVRGGEGIGIYLDDFANGVTVSRNTIRNNTRGMVLHNAFDVAITGNRFASNAVVHLGFGQDGGTVRGNRVTGNLFASTGGEWTYSLETGANLKTFAVFDANVYTSRDASVFGRTWDGRSAGVTTSFAAWRAWSGQDRNSTMNGR